MTRHGVLIRTVKSYSSPKLANREDRKARYQPDLVSKGTTNRNLVCPISGTPGCFVGKAMPLEIYISDKATVRIEGRGNQTLHWITVATFTASGLYSIPALFELRATLWGNTGTVQVTQRP